MSTVHYLGEGQPIPICGALLGDNGNAPACSSRTSDVTCRKCLASLARTQPVVIDAEFVDLKDPTAPAVPSARDKTDPKRSAEPMLEDAAEALRSASKAAEVVEKLTGAAPGTAQQLKEAGDGLHEVGQHVQDAIESSKGLRARLEGYAKTLDRMRGSPVFKRRVRWGSKNP